MSGAPGVDHWLRLLRIGNAPTCVTNALAGAGLAWASSGAALEAGRVALAAASIVLLYFGGMVINDVIDAGRDARERPERPIPAGAIGRRAAGIAAIALLAGGWAIAAWLGAGAWAAGLVVAIVAYDALHGRAALPAVLMGLCRGLALVVAAVGVAGGAELDRPLVALVAGGMTVYVTVLTLVARHEARDDPGPWSTLAWLMPLAGAGPAWILLAAGGGWELGRLVPMFVGTVVLVERTVGVLGLVRRSRRHLIAAIQSMVAAIALVDALVLLALGRPSLALAAVGAWVATILAHRVVRGS